MWCCKLGISVKRISTCFASFFLANSSTSLGLIRASEYHTHHPHVGHGDDGGSGQNSGAKGGQLGSGDAPGGPFGSGGLRLPAQPSEGDGEDQYSAGEDAGQLRGEGGEAQAVLKDGDGEQPKDRSPDRAAAAEDRS